MKGWTANRVAVRLAQAAQRESLQVEKQQAVRMFDTLVKNNPDDGGRLGGFGMSRLSSATMRVDIDQIRN